MEHNTKKYVSVIHFCNQLQELEIHLLQKEADLYTTHSHKLITGKESYQYCCETVIVRIYITHLYIPTLCLSKIIKGLVCFDKMF